MHSQSRLSKIRNMSKPQSSAKGFGNILCGLRIQTRLILAFLMVSLIPLGVTGYVSYVRSSSAIESKIGSYSSQVMKQEGKNIEAELLKLDGIAKDIALSTDVQSGLSTQAARPGMPIITRMANGNYLMTYEIMNSSNGGSFYQISSNPLSWNVTSSGTKFGGGGSPYCTYLNGMLVLSDNSTGNL